MGLFSKNAEYQLSTTCQIPKLSSIYELFIGYKKNGFFVEFGAFDGEKFSNTSGLADIGWKGLYIEPVAEYYLECKKRHEKNNVVVLNFAVGEINDHVQISKGGPLSTISKEVVNKFNKLSWAKGFHNNVWEKVEQKTLNELFHLGQVPQNFDVLSIDVEGYEWNAIKNFDIIFWKPKIVIIELHDNNREYDIEWQNAQRLINYFEESSYRVVYKDFSNTIYLRGDLKQFGVKS